MQASYYVSRKMVLVFRKMTVDKFRTIQLFVSNKDYAYIKLLSIIHFEENGKEKERKKKELTRN